MKRYNPKEIEPRWQSAWNESKIYQAEEGSEKPKRYVLEYFPYPSGSAMHVGHVRNYTIGDAIARFWRMQGYNVMHPMGWDAFGLPAENFAIKNKTSPQRAVAENVENFKKQLMQMGFSYDWSREINSTDPSYYKWTQWFFKLLFERGLAYQKDSLQWWCETDKTVLANEQVESGRCWRCGNEVIKKPLKQWFFKITDYADRLHDDLDDLDWSESIKQMQRNWIGKSVGAEIEFEIKDSTEKLKVYTTRPDTLYGATFMVLSPEHPLVASITTAQVKAEVDKYIIEAQKKSEVERMETEREKTGVFTGAYALNPATKKPIPIWIADYVLVGYGTGAIMAVPAHDERDFEFAQKFQLEIIQVIDGGELPFSSEGKLINSGEFSDKSSSDARSEIAQKFGAEKTNYKIRDWLISRQRYWGAPIPIIHCDKDGAVVVPDNDLPVVLPEIETYEPSGDGRSPLARVESFVNTTCPKCGGPAKRETDTMDGFACSSWYFLRFADPKNENKAFDKEKVKYWLPVDDYIGGAEHAVMHLLYARMWTKVAYDTGLIGFNEPFKSLRNQGMILAPDGRKMSKSWGNVIAPDDLISQGYGADTVRLMELFIGPWNQEASWSIEGMGGCFRFLQRFWTLTQEFIDSEKNGSGEQLDVFKVAHRSIKDVSRDMHEMGYNTAIAGLMDAVNQLYKIKASSGFSDKDAWNFALKSLVKLLAPFAPHITEELWQNLGEKDSVHTSSWPVHDEKYLETDEVTIVIQVNGKVRASITTSKDASEDTVVEAAKKDPKVQAHLKNKEVHRTIYVPQKLVNFVV